MKFKLQPYSLQELGQRENQEDSMFPALGESTTNDRLFILCDGMGGHEKGEVASATVCETMSSVILSRWNPNEPLSDELLLQAIDEAYDALDAKDKGELKKMGTTMTFLCFHADGVTVAHIGDSRVYQLRPHTYECYKNDYCLSPSDLGYIDKYGIGGIVFKTRDHSLVNDLIKIGEITEEEAKNHPQKNVITRAMQPCQEHRSKATIAHLTDVQPGDYFYMCSDGMLEQTTDENLLFILSKQKASDKEKVEMLRNVTEENKDNHTAHLIKVLKVEASNISSPKGTLVTPTMAKERKSPLLAVIVVLLVMIVGLLVALFMKDNGKDDTERPKSEVNDSLNNEVQKEKKDSSKVKTAAPEKSEIVTPTKKATAAPTKVESKTTPKDADTKKDEPAKEEKPATSTKQKKQASSVDKFLNPSQDSKQQKGQDIKTEKQNP